MFFNGFRHLGLDVRPVEQHFLRVCYQGVMKGYKDGSGRLRDRVADSETKRLRYSEGALLRNSFVDRCRK